eukprot:CAMPEP_0197292950 /NCGR_PEP_ID=MMETSP0890-20130614/25990_1 /TAXON_ID=44058 ORGANISM="Aureoumbra lagunensis, Strain CCMP1510" /NCGR_SAMPLE_ID=MMETSP0890 /ASSEMBLY_ACC=CAM_ASM_000533 /LENGTH=324 /DNA_ID=CAMNT_0042767287 /DNA_START=403 /DNA_END=1377 /DNA_ORIENTATION=-
MVTCYDYPSAMHVDGAGIDVALCGDSLGMVALGMATTQPVRLEEMVHHCKAVRRGLSSQGPMLVCDLPFGSYEESPEQALKSAFTCVKEAGADAVKLEGGRIMACAIEKIVNVGGIAVMGHVGLTPQKISTLGGFRAQGRTAVKARAVLDDALALQDAGAFAVVAECVPDIVGRALAENLEIPVIGIGAGSYVDGQVLVYHDLLGSLHHPHHKRFVPKFCKVFADIGEASRLGLQAFKDEVQAGSFPSADFSPYKMPTQEAAKFRAMLHLDEDIRLSRRRETHKRIIDADEYENIGLYGGGNSNTFSPSSASTTTNGGGDIQSK